MVSQHLLLLRRDGLLASRRDGQTIYYSLQGDAVGSVLQTLYDIHCVPDGATDGTVRAASADEDR